MPEPNPTLLDRWIAWFKNHRLFAILLLGALAIIGVGELTGAIKKSISFIVDLTQPDQFPELLEQAKNAYARQKFEFAKELFDDLAIMAKNDLTYRDEFESLRAASLASENMVEALAKRGVFELKTDSDDSDRLERESAMAWDKANDNYPYGVQHDELLSSE